VEWGKNICTTIFTASHAINEAFSDNK